MSNYLTNKDLRSLNLTCIYHSITLFVIYNTFLRIKLNLHIALKCTYLCRPTITISRSVPESQCMSAAPEIGEGGQDILAVRLEEENTICCKISDIIAVTCDEQQGFR